MKSWRERAIEEGQFTFGMTCCAAPVPIGPEQETVCSQCGQPASLNEVLAAHGITRADLPLGFTLNAEPREATRARGWPE